MGSVLNAVALSTKPDVTRFLDIDGLRPDAHLEILAPGPLCDQHDGILENQFVEMRTSRDATLGMPRLILPPIQVNMRGGKLPPAEDNDRRYLRIPLNAL